MQLRILTEIQLSRIWEHFNLIHKNNIMLTDTFRDIEQTEIMVFVLRYIKPPLQHYKVLEDDVEDIAKYFKEHGIKFPIL